MLAVFLNPMMKSKWTVCLMACFVLLGSSASHSESSDWTDRPQPPVPLFGHWEVEYDLAGSEFETRNTPLGAADTTHVVGPGTMTVRFEADASGSEGSIREGGTAHIVQLDLMQQFTLRTRVFGFRADVTTRIRSAIPDNRWDGNPAGRVSMGSSDGTINGATMTVTAPGMRSYHTLGSVLCEGSGCRFGRLRSGVATRIDSDRDVIELRALYFGAGGPLNRAGFMSNEIALPLTPRAAPYLRLLGREVHRIFVPPTGTETAIAARACYSVLDCEAPRVEPFAQEEEQ
jgi:hypothetical protein